MEIRVVLCKTIQEDEFEPFKVEIEGKTEVIDEKDAPEKINQLRKMIEEQVEQAILDRIEAEEE